ncbi:MAG: hypothetical protein NTU58_04000 [Candidatus Nealsonbacteria bacterium]|nr:hypothetical protein [Candidatus Nealsonbacteria bacterium]
MTEKGMKCPECKEKLVFKPMDGCLVTFCKVCESVQIIAAIDEGDKQIISR